MTKAMPVIVVGGIFDLARMFFHLFWFFGPAAAALYCTLNVSDTLASWSFGLLGTKTAAIACSAGAAVIGAAGVAATAPFGVIMAGAVGLIGFLTIGLWVVMTNARILKAVSTAPLQFAGAFAVGEVPFLGAFPVFSFILWRLYRGQIKTEKAAYAKWKKETAAARLQQQNQQAAQLMQIQTAQQAQFQQEQVVQQEAANEAQYEQTQAANDEIPEDEKLAA